MAAQALALRRVVPGTGTIDIVSCRARVVLFRIVLVLARRARAKWPGIDTQLINRREDGIRGMDHSINPRNSRDAEQHTYKTRGSTSLVVQESKSDIK
jgi:hypothetical protein